MSLHEIAPNPAYALYIRQQERGAYYRLLQKMTLKSTMQICRTNVKKLTATEKTR